MYKDLKDGRIVGVLNDFDLACTVDPTQPLPEASEPDSGRGIGTVPYISFDLLTHEWCKTIPPHMYRHDLESLFWVMHWHTHRYEDGKLVSCERPSELPFEDWKNVSLSDLHHAKVSQLMFESLKPTNTYQALCPLLEGFQWAFGDGYMQAKFDQRGKRGKDREGGSNSDAAPKFDQYTLGGHVTFDVLEKLFIEHRPSN